MLDAGCGTGALALELADHVYLLETGRVVTQGPSELVKNDGFRDAAKVKLNKVTFRFINDPAARVAALAAAGASTTGGAL